MTGGGAAATDTGASQQKFQLALPSIPKQGIQGLDKAKIEEESALLDEREKRMQAHADFMVSQQQRQADAWGAMSDAIIAAGVNFEVVNGDMGASIESSGRQMLNSIRKIIAGFLAQSVAGAITAAFNPPTPASAALAAAGAASTAMLFNTAVPQFAQGGLVSGPTYGLMGEYAGASSNPEFIAPADKAVDIFAAAMDKKGMSGSGTQNLNISGELKASGNDLRMVINKQSRRDSYLYS